MIFFTMFFFTMIFYWEHERDFHHDFFCLDFTIDFEWDFMGTRFFYCEYDVKW